MTVTAPDVSVWWYPAAVTGAALARLRLTDGDVDAAAVAASVPAAGQMVNQYLDRDPADAFTEATAPPDLVDCVAQVVDALYRRKDNPAADVTGAMLGAWQPTAIDPLADVRRILDRYRTRRGVG